uniref:3'-5' exonuclease n=1 Tax=uncultured Thiotrichaceae bacterium TaxID=298394 RepID=A0A6S6RXZ4_9GAMM|nr:MAG: 3'-5' exonuclease [uncultured Thiotrichaceae bacterium]
MNTLAYSLITIPDFETGAKLQGLENLDDKGAAKALFHLQAQKTGDESLPSYLQHIVAISVVLVDESGNVQMETIKADLEADILNTFFDIVEHYKPTLVAWNGEHFASEIINYRTVKQALQLSPHYENKENHFDLNEALMSSSEKTSLTEIATLLGFDGEEGKDDRAVWESYLSEEFDQLDEYCESNAINTYQIYLRYQLTHGAIDEKAYNALMDQFEPEAKA